MVKKDLAQKIAEKHGLTKTDAERVVNTIFETIQDELVHGGEVNIIGFGKFYVKDRNEREARNPKTGEIIKVPACKVPLFKAGKNLKELVK